MIKHKLIDIIPKNELDRVFGYEKCEIDYEFMGFTDIYKQLSYIIPKHFCIIDLGCYCAAQSYYFLNYKQYIGVDVFKGERFITGNAKHYTKSIQQFIEEDSAEYNLNESFAICSYVPDEDAKQKVRIAFTNLFVYYPTGIMK